MRLNTIFQNLLPLSIKICQGLKARRNFILNEQDFLLKPDQATLLQQYHLTAINYLNEDGDILSCMNAGITRKQLWQHFEDSIKCVIILWTNTHACILKGFDPDHSHFIGLLEPVKNHVLPIELVKKYAFSE